jgi:serine acetyltransferase
MEYFRGMREECGSLLETLRSHREYLVKAARAETWSSRIPRRRALWLKAWADLHADHGWYEDRYGYKQIYERSFRRDLLEKIGLQIAAGYRLMRFFREAELPMLAKLTARALRHVYASDIHWNADLAPGIMFVHGMGLAIHGAARIGPRCVIAQNVTLGLGLDRETRVEGAPTLEADVRVGAGATLLGPITVGAGSKIMPGVVLMQSVPPNSIVESPAAVVRERVLAPEPENR